MGMYISKNGHGYFFLHIYAAFHSSSSLLILKKGNKNIFTLVLTFLQKTRRRKTDTLTYIPSYITGVISLTAFCYYYYVLLFVLISPSLLGAAPLPPSILKWLSGSLSLPKQCRKTLTTFYKFMKSFS